MPNKMTLITLLTLISGFATQSSAKETQYQLTFGGFYAQTDSQITVTDPIIGQDFDLDFERDLKLRKTQALPFFELTYRHNQSHNFYFDWKSLHRTSEQAVIAKPFQVEIKDKIYDIRAGGKLQSSLNIDIARIGYGYDFLQTDHYALGISAGVHVMLIETIFKGDIAACIESELIDKRCGSTSTPALVDNKLSAPLPDFGLYGYYEFQPNWRFKAHSQYFYMKLDDVKGGLIDIRAGLEVDFADNWSLSAAYHYYQVDVDMEQTKTKLDIHIADYNIYYSFSGPALALSYHF